MNTCTLLKKQKKDRTLLSRDGELHTKVLVNRIELKAKNTSRGFIEWDAETGFIVSDTSGTYAIRNPLFDKINTEYHDSVFKIDRLRNNRTQESKIS